MVAAPFGKPGKKAGGEEVAGAGGVDDLVGGFGRHLDDGVAGQHHGTLFRPGDDADLGLAALFGDGALEIVGPVERLQLVLVGEDDVDAAACQRDEIAVMAIDAEHVRQGEGGPAAVGAGNVARLQHRRARRRRVPQIAFEIGDRACRHRVIVDVEVGEMLAGAKEGVHGALRIGRHQDEAARGRHIAPGERRFVADAGGADVVREHLAELVVGNAADELDAATERGGAGGGIGARPARNLAADAHGGVKRLRLVGVDETHAALGQLMAHDEVVVAVRDDVDDGVADDDDVVAAGHPGS